MHLVPTLFNSFDSSPYFVMNTQLNLSLFSFFPFLVSFPTFSPSLLRRSLREDLLAGVGGGDVVQQDLEVLGADPATSSERSEAKRA